MILENIPNVGEVVVISPEPLTWQISLLFEIGNVEMSLAENKVFDNDMVNGDVSIVKISDGGMPADSAYGFEVIEDANDLVVDGAMHYIIKHLVPGINIFVRVSSRNQVGFGPRRETAPAFSALFIDSLSNIAQGTHWPFVLRWRFAPHLILDRVGLVAHVRFV